MHGLQLPRLLCPWDFPSKNTRGGCHFLLQGIFPTQGSKPGLLHCRQTLYPLSHQGSHNSSMLLLLLLLSRFKSCPTLCDPIDGSPPGSPIPGILQIRILEWVAATPWTAAYQALPSMGFSRQEYWSGVPLPSP